MPRHLDMVDVIHGGPADPPVIPRKPHRLYQVHRHSEARAQAEDRAHVSRDLRFEESYPHGRRLPRMVRPRKSPASGKRRV